MQDDYLLLMGEAGEATSGLGALLLEYGSPSAAIAAPEERLAALPVSTQQGLHRARQRWHPGGRRCGSGSVSVNSSPFVAITDRAYPDALRAISDPPPWLFFSGDASCLKRPAIAMVGSRRASHAGVQIARRVARDLARRGYLVCSGLALGIDAAAHEGALEAGETVAVLASGLDQASPRRNVGLARRIRSSGCLLSELPHGTPPNRARFPRRNRISVASKTRCWRNRRGHGSK